jgi:hypothetical protein
MEGKPASLYTRLGGYDAIAAVVDDLLPRLRSDELLSPFLDEPPGALIPLTASGNWLLISSPQPQEGRRPFPQ